MVSRIDIWGGGGYRNGCGKSQLQCGVSLRQAFQLALNQKVKSCRLNPQQKLLVTSPAPLAVR